jgi:hypothetical protein
MRLDIHLYFHAGEEVRKALAELIRSNHQLTGDFAKMAQDIQSTLDELTASVNQETTVNQSAITLIQGIPALISAAVAAAQAAGATPAQLQAFEDLNTKITANASGLAAAVTAGTSAAPTA